MVYFTQKSLHSCLRLSRWFLYVYYSDAFKNKVRALVLWSVDSNRHNHVRRIHHNAQRVDEHTQRLRHQQLHSNWHRHGNKSLGAIPDHSGPSEIAHVISTTVFTGCMLIGGDFAYRYLRYRDPEERAMLGRGYAHYIRSRNSGIACSRANRIEPDGDTRSAAATQYAVFDANGVPGSAYPERIFGTFVNGNWVGGIQIPGVQGFLASMETGVGQSPGMSTVRSIRLATAHYSHDFYLMVLGAFLAGGFLLLWLLGVFLKKKPFEHK